MKKYFIEVTDPYARKGVRLTALKARDLDEAKSEVRWNYANSGVRTILTKHYRLVRKTRVKVDTRYDN